NTDPSLSISQNSTEDNDRKTVLEIKNIIKSLAENLTTIYENIRPNISNLLIEQRIGFLAKNLFFLKNDVQINIFKKLNDYLSEISEIFKKSKNTFHISLISELNKIQGNTDNLEKLFNNTTQTEEIEKIVTSLFYTLNALSKVIEQLEETDLPNRL